MAEHETQENETFDQYLKDSSPQQLAQDLQVWDERRAVSFGFIGAGIATLAAALYIDTLGKSDLNEYGTMIMGMGGFGISAIVTAIDVRLSATSHAISEELKSRGAKLKSRIMVRTLVS